MKLKPERTCCERTETRRYGPIGLMLVVGLLYDVVVRVSTREALQDKFERGWHDVHVIVFKVCSGKCVVMSGATVLYHVPITVCILHIFSAHP